MGKWQYRYKVEAVKYAFDDSNDHSSSGLIPVYDHNERL